MAKLGKLEKQGFEKAWKDESDFTDWLASDDGISLLSDALGVGLEAVATEHSIGDFRADLICRDTTEGALVVVENQINRSNHTHLGQVLTYSAGAEATNVVWISTGFRDEHRATVDWLNEVTGDRFRFFALAIEVWSIGKSKIAPKLNVVSQPNDWRKVIKIQVESPEGLTGSMDRVAFWTRVNRLIQDEDPIGRPKPADKAFVFFGSKSVRQVRLGGSFSTLKGTLRVHLELRGEHGLPHAKLLCKQKSDIESEIGSALAWPSKPAGKTHTVSLYRAGVDIEDESEWDDYAEWLVKYLNRFHRAFWDRIDDIDPKDYDGPNQGP